jgi:uncharacterized protein (UPF0218 family)
MLSLPRTLRGELKEPMGPLFTHPEALLSEAGEPLIAVGDVVTYHLRLAGRDPDVSVVDGRTKRHEVGEEIKAVLNGDDPRVRAENPPGDLSEGLLRALVEALGREEPVVVHVDGEEDLATLPAILAAPAGASVVYGQPDEGMVLVPVNDETKAFARDLLSRMDGDSEAAFSVLGV